MNESRSVSPATAEATSPPFDCARFDDLLDEAGMDAVVVCSKHNIQYLLGGYRFFFFDFMDAIGVKKASFVGNSLGGATSLMVTRCMSRTSCRSS